MECWTWMNFEIYDMVAFDVDNALDVDIADINEINIDKLRLPFETIVTPGNDSRDFMLVWAETSEGRTETM